MSDIDLAEYIVELLNINSSNVYVHNDIYDDLSSISDKREFLEFIKKNISNTKYQYKNGINKYISLSEDYKNIILAPTPQEHKMIVTFNDKLFNDITYLMESLREKKIPSQEYLETINLSQTKDKTRKDGLFFNEKQMQVINKIGNTTELYRLSTQNKPLLQEKIRQVVDQLVKEKKSNKIKVLHNNNKRIK